MGQPFEAFDLVEDGVERLPLHLVVRHPGTGQLELAPDDGDRRAQLVAGVVEEGPFPGGGVVDPVEHGVEPGGEGPQLGAAARDRQPLARLVGRDRVGLLDHRPDGLEHGAGQEPAAEDDHDRQDREPDAEGVLQLLLEVPRLVEAGGGHEDVSAPPDLHR